MELPSKLYRYRPIRTDGKHWNNLLKREAKSVFKKYLWLSKFEDLNDPMESYLNPQSDYGICSFSKHPNNMMLWSLYAKNTGICIGYNTDILLSHPNVEEIIEVKYNFRETLTPGVDVKFEEWNGEQEIRLLSKNPGILSFEEDSMLISDIYLAVDFGKLPSGNKCQCSTNFAGQCIEENIVMHPFALGPNT